jgi:hypothetical protein
MSAAETVDETEDDTPRTERRSKEEPSGERKKKRDSKVRQAKNAPEVDEDPDADDRLREAHYETFPASDPPSYTPER